MYYCKPNKAIGVAPGWKQLSALHSLSFALGRENLSDQEACVLLSSLRSATKLTKLEISIDGALHYGMFADDVMLCQYLTGVLAKQR